MSQPLRPGTERAPLRIAFVLNALATGGAEIHTVGLARALADRGHDCRLMPLRALEQIDRQGIAIEPVNGNALTDRAAMRRLGAALERFGADLVVAVNGRPAAYAQLARLLGGARRRPVAMIYHTTNLLDVRQKLQFAANLPFVNMSDGLIFVSGKQRAYCMRQGMRGRRVLTIHNGIDAARFNAAARARHRAAIRAKLGLEESAFVIAQSAAFRPEKNHTQALAALAALRGQGIDARLLLLGDGPCRPQIEATRDALGLGEAVILAGRQDDVMPWLSAGDVGILTSTAIETFSLAALEFMALGLPGVLSDIGGASEMVRDGETGRLFPVGDTPKLVEILAELADPAGACAAMGARAARFVNETFTLETMTERYLSVFSEMVI